MTNQQHFRAAIAACKAFEANMSEKDFAAWMTLSENQRKEIIFRGYLTAGKASGKGRA